MNRALPSTKTTSVPAEKTTSIPRRAMPGWAVDRIRRGVPSSELRAHGGTKAVYGGLVSTAMSAIQSGHTWADWHAAVTSPQSRLGQQARLDNRLLDIGPTRHKKVLESAWGRAEARITESPAFTSSEVRQRARGILDSIDKTPWAATISAVDKLVYRHAVAEAERRGHTRPVLPIRGVTDATGVPTMTASRALRRLADAGLLRLHRPGRRARGKSGRAAIYVVEALTAPNRSLPVNGPYVPRRQDHMYRVASPPVPPTRRTAHA